MLINIITNDIYIYTYIEPHETIFTHYKYISKHLINNMQSYSHPKLIYKEYNTIVYV